MMENIIIRAQRQLFSGKIEVACIKEYGDKAEIAVPAEFKQIDSNLFCEPFLLLSTNSAQMLMDELWNCGIRPSEGTGSAGSLAATERHLKDLQRLVFKDK